MRRFTGQVGVQSSRSSIEVCSGEIELRLLFIGHVRGRLILSSRADSVPSFSLLLHVGGCLDVGESTTKASVGDDIEASVQFFSNTLVRYLSKRHLIESLVFGDSFGAHSLFSVVSGLVSLLLVKLTLIFLVESILVIHTVIDRVEHHGLFLDTDWQFLDLILAVDGSLSITVLSKGLLFITINIGDSNWIKIASLPEGLGGLVFVDLVIDLHLIIMVLQVAVSHHVVVSLSFRFHLLASLSL